MLKGPLGKGQREAAVGDYSVRIEGSRERDG